MDKEKEMMSKGYYCNEENAKIIERLISKHKNRNERIQ